MPVALAYANSWNAPRPPSARLTDPDSVDGHSLRLRIMIILRPHPVPPRIFYTLPLSTNAVSLSVLTYIFYKDTEVLPKIGKKGRLTAFLTDTDRD